MPTTKPRHAITEDAAITRTLEIAARRWPEDRNRPAALLRRLALAGARSLEDQEATATAERLGQIKTHAGAATGSYSSTYLDDLRAEWG